MDDVDLQHQDSAEEYDDEDLDSDYFTSSNQD